MAKQKSISISDATVFQIREAMSTFSITEPPNTTDIKEWFKNTYPDFETIPIFEGIGDKDNIDNIDPAFDPKALGKERWVAQLSRRWTLPLLFGKQLHHLLI